jgi:hypothetical protein
MPPVTTDSQVNVEVLDSGQSGVQLLDEAHIIIELHGDEVLVSTACERGAPGTARIRSEPHDVTEDGLVSITLAAPPAWDWELVHLNGVLLRRGDDYTLAGAVVTFDPGWVLEAGDRVDVVYPY